MLILAKNLDGRLLKGTEEAVLRRIGGTGSIVGSVPLGGGGENLLRALKDTKILGRDRLVSFLERS